MKEYIYKQDFKVRDYELDMEGVVNNATYMNYLEHSRHEFLLSIGINFAELAEKNLPLMVAKAELEYKFPLRSGDRFWVGINIYEHSKVRVVFEQDIYSYPDNKLILKAKVTGTGLNERGRPKLPDEVISKLGVV